MLKGVSPRLPVNRKYLAGLIVVLAAIVQAAAAQTTLNYQFRVARGDGDIRYSNCAFGPDGRLYVVFGRSISALFPPVSIINSIWMVSYDGVVPSKPFNVSGPTMVGAHQPDIFVGKTGLIAVVWGSAGANAVFLRTFDPTTNAWGAIETVCQGNGNIEPAVIVDSKDNIFVAWQYSFSGWIFSRAKINGQWSSLYPHAYSYYVSPKQHHLALGPDDFVHLVWIEQNVGTFTGRYSKRSWASSWTDPEEWAIQGAPTHPSITITPDSVPWVASGEAVEPNGLSAEIWVMNLNHPAERYKVGSNIDQHYPHIVADSNGKLHVAIQRGGNDIGDGVLYANNLVNHFQDLQYLPGASNTQQGLASDGTGNTALCWTSLNLGQKSSEIFVATLNPIIIRPAPPLHPRVVSISPGMTTLTPTFALTWSKNFLNDDADLAGYRIYTKTLPGAWTAVLSLRLEALSASIPIDGGKKTQIAIAAVATNGLEGEKAIFLYGPTVDSRRR